MISGDVHGPVSNIGNNNSGVIANTVNTVNIVQSNRSELDAELDSIADLTRMIAGTQESLSVCVSVTSTER
jgi:hypothetical protein